MRAVSVVSAGSGVEPDINVVPELECVFSGDSDRRLKAIQSATFPELAAELYSAARNRVLAAARFVGVETEMVCAVKARSVAPGGPLLRPYRKVAAFFRYACHAGPQLPLPLEGESYEAKLQAEWEAFFRRETAELLRTNPVMRSLLGAAVFDGLDRGRVSEDRLLDLLDARYGRLTLDRRLLLLGGQHDEESLAWRFAEEADWLRLLRVPGSLD